MLRQIMSKYRIYSLLLIMNICLEYMNIYVEYVWIYMEYDAPNNRYVEYILCGK